MANPTWPATLPNIQYPAPNSGYRRVATNQAITSDVDVGPPKMRRRFSGIHVPFTLRVDMRQTQVDALETFYYDTLGVVMPFDWIDHLTRDPATLRFRSPPEYEPIGVDPAGVAWWHVTLSLEILP